MALGLLDPPGLRPLANHGIRKRRNRAPFRRKGRGPHQERKVIVKPNLNPRTRHGLSACVLVMMAVLASLAYGACSSHGGRVPAAADGPPPTLREALSPDHLDRVALLDAQTPFPPTAGTAALFVDGDFYAQAADAVRSYVRQRLQEGLPVALFGDQSGYEELRSSVGAAADLPAEPALDGRDEDPGSPNPANPPAGARGLKVYPSRSPGELPRPAAIEVSGSPDNPTPLIESLIRWAEDCAAQPN